MLIKTGEVNTSYEIKIHIKVFLDDEEFPPPPPVFQTYAEQLSGKDIVDDDDDFPPPPTPLQPGNFISTPILFITPSPYQSPLPPPPTLSSPFEIDIQTHSVPLSDTDGTPLPLATQCEPVPYRDASLSISYKAYSPSLSNPTPVPPKQSHPKSQSFAPNPADQSAANDSSEEPQVLTSISSSPLLTLESSEESFNQTKCANNKWNSKK